MYDLSREKPLLWQRDSLKSTVICLAMDPSGSRLAVASYTGPIEVREVSSAKVLATLTTSGRCWALAFSRDGAYLAVGTAQPTLWDVRTSKVVHTLRSPCSWDCTALDFSADGRLLAARFRDGQAVVWDISSGRVVLAPVRHSGAIVGAAFSPDGSSGGRGCRRDDRGNRFTPRGDSGLPRADGAPLQRPRGARLQRRWPVSLLAGTTASFVCGMAAHFTPDGGSAADLETREYKGFTLLELLVVIPALSA